jgi:endo-1,4-beta-xylanase
MKKILESKLIIGLVIFLTLNLISANNYAQNVDEVEARLAKKANENIEKYRKGDVVVRFVTDDDKAFKDAKVEVFQTSHDFLIGCIIFDFVRSGEVYRGELFKQRFKSLFNFAVFPFYWPGYERTQGMPLWEDRIETIEWCKANGITTKGHPLVWACRSGVPQWLRGYTIAETEELSKARVMSITRGFTGKIDIWDVVNEPVNVKTWKNKLANMDDQHDWGVVDPLPEIADYVEDALKWAYKGNPEAQLIINEFNTIAEKDVRQRFDELLKELEKRKAPISGIGIQAHEPRQEWYPPQEVWNTFDMYAKFGHPIHITELHPQSGGKEITGGWRTGTWNLETQTEFTEQFVRLCFGHPSVASINWWGFSDRRIWLPGGGLIDEEYRPKPVYEMLYKLFNEEWRTKLSTQSDSKGNIAFRGFYGKYDIKLTTPDGKVKTFPVHVRKDEENKWVFTVK